MESEIDQLKARVKELEVREERLLARISALEQHVGLDNSPLMTTSVENDNKEKTIRTGAGNENAREKEPFEDTEKFHKFLKSVMDRGFFGDHKPGSKEYDTRYQKVLTKYKQKFGDDNDDLTSKPTLNDTAKAEQFKTRGNEAIKVNDYQKAYEEYTKALEICPTGENAHIYYCNRAAALQFLDRDEEAANDCSAAIALKADYVKAHTRLAQANLKLGRKKEAKESARRALELEPGNLSARQILKAAGDAKVTPPAVPGSGMPPGFPGMPGMGGFPGLPPGMDLGAMMQNPQIMEAAQKLMQDPQAMQNMMNMMGGMMGGGDFPGGSPRGAGQDKDDDDVEEVN